MRSFYFPFRIRSDHQDRQYLHQTGNMVSNLTARASGSVAQQTVYFAYGSNLHLAQMAKRCPESRFLGRGVLRNFKWQINRRGVANIVISDGDNVEGLCYLLSQKDEKKLDTSEGVSLSPPAYEKYPLDIEVLSAGALIAGRRVREVNDLVNPRGHQGRNGLRVPVESQRNQSRWQTVSALVYVNFQITTDAGPREEYIDRINAGIKDAEALGIPPGYFEKYVHIVMRGRYSGTRAQGTHPCAQRQDEGDGQQEATHFGRGRERSGGRRSSRVRTSTEYIDGVEVVTVENVRNPTSRMLVIADAMRRSPRDRTTTC